MVHGVAKSQTWLSNFTFTYYFHALEKEMATQSSVLAWRIPGVGDPGGLTSPGSHRVGYYWSDLAAAHNLKPFPFDSITCWYLKSESKWYNFENVLGLHLAGSRGSGSLEIEEVADVTKVSFGELRTPFVFYYSTQNFKLDFKLKHILPWNKECLLC